MARSDPGGADWDRTREAVLERDRHQCTNCGRPEAVVAALQVDHNVPRGRGGADRFGNYSTECRQCHDAKHGHGLAPTVEFRSTGSMDEYEFVRFRHFFNEVVPALARAVGVRTVPKFGLDDRDAWHIPLGDLKHLDAALAAADAEYNSLQAAEYM